MNEQTNPTLANGYMTSSDEDETSFRDQSQQRIADAKLRAGESVDQATTALGRSMERLGEAVQSATVSATDPVQRAGRYMQVSDPQTMGRDFVGMMQRNPGKTLLLGMGMGYMLTRMLGARPVR